MIAIALVSWTCACVDELLPPDCADEGAACRDSEEPATCICADIYEPVCGENGTTYGNACEADCAGVATRHEGECEPAPGDAGEPSPDAGEGCICPAIYKPVCGEDGKTYGSACEAACGKVPVAHEGECEDGGDGGMSCHSSADCAKGQVCHPPTHQCQPECSIACLVYDPVCGRDGQTYGCGRADAHCHGVEVAYPGECKKQPCACTKDYRPVCGADGTTYGNRCMADCAGAAIAHDGPCAAPSGGCSYGGKTYEAGASFPADDGCNTCRCAEGGLVACTLKACACDYSDPGRRWVVRSADQCKLVKFACEAGQRPFFDACGCGCEAAPATCRVGGCSGQLCVGPGDPDVSTCEWREEYACYRSATCEPQASGRCGWTPSDALRRCLEQSR